MSRRSTRLASKPAPQIQLLEDYPGKIEDAEFHEVESSDFDGDSEEPASKKRKRTTALSKSRPIRAKRGRLGQLPLDILYEIFGHVRPQDLLRLSRTTKALRRILMQRSAISIWKAVMGQVEGLPECPSDLNEPQFASLAFDSYCHVSSLPAFNIKASQTESYVTRQISIQSFGCAGSEVARSVSMHKYYTRRICLERDASAVQDILHALKADQEKYNKYIQEKEAEIKALREHATLCEAWQRGRGSERQEELDALKNKRRDAILGKLRELGYGPELDQDRYRLTVLYKHAPMNKAQELTLRIWTNIKEPIISIMNDLRRDRLKREHAEALTGRLKVLSELVKEYTAEQPIHEIIPGLGDISHMADFKRVIVGPSDDVQVTKDDFKEAMERLPQLIAGWRAEKEAELVRLMLNTNPDDANSQDISTSDNTATKLELAKAHFDCKSCHQAISYPRVLVHRCLIAYKTWMHAADPYDDEKILRSCEGTAPWDNSNSILTFGGKTQACIGKLLAVCELDPDRTTAQEMDEKDFRWGTVVRTTPGNSLEKSTPRVPKRKYKRVDSPRRSMEAVKPTVDTAARVCTAIT
ncbi:hypothetical protein HWV62_24754 [Athelia sp. TMB]|nr:hypothetical protein HWV62_24754 [Athelia sp. TMB]